MSKSVLIVEDDGLLRWALHEALRREGLPVLEARDGREASQRLATDPALVVLDLNLPDRDGWRFFHELRESRPSCPVILMTASPSAEGEREARGLGALRYIAKPFDLHEMVSAVRQGLQLAGLRKGDRGPAAPAPPAGGEMHLPPTQG